MTGNKVQVNESPVVAWSFFTKHALVLLYVAENPEIRLSEIARSVELTERRVHGILTDLIDSGYVIRAKRGRRNRYEVRNQLPIPDFVDRVRAVGDFLSLLDADRAQSRGLANFARGGGTSPVE